MQKIIGVIGKLASGKDTALNYISEKLDLPVYIISSELKEIAYERNIEINRKNLCDLGKNVAIEYGDDYLAKRILDKNSDSNIILIGGMRQIGQIDLLQKSKKLILINIISDQEIRFKRMRNRNTHGDPQTFHEFKKVENIDNGGQGVQKIGECEKLANYIIENNGNLKSLYEKIDLILEKK